MPRASAPECQGNEGDRGGELCLPLTVLTNDCQSTVDLNLLSRSSVYEISIIEILLASWKFAFRERFVLNGLTRMAIRATSDHLQLSPPNSSSSDGSHPDPLRGLGIHVVSPSHLLDPSLAVDQAKEATSPYPGSAYLPTPFSLLARLIWRAYQVIQTPNEILVDKLGLDIPPAPELTLEEIQPREVHIAWKSPELPNSIHKHIVHLNGKKSLFAQ